MQNFRLPGLTTAVFTPFDEAGNLKLEVIGNYARYLIARKINGVFICGTSGEGLLMSVEERKKVLEAWMPFKKQLRVIAHISTTNYIDSIALAKHAEQVGVDAISCMGPCYLPPKRAEELVAFNQIIAASAPHTPYYYYHLPDVSHVHIRMCDFLKLAHGTIPTLAGIKFTSSDLMDMQECILMEGKSYDILNGHDGILLSGLMAGATGGIGTSYNLISEVFLAIISAFERGNFEVARSLQYKASVFVKIMRKYESSVVSTKAMLNMAGLDLGPCRLPLRNLSRKEYAALEQDLHHLDFHSFLTI